MHSVQIPVEIWEEIFRMVEKRELLSLSTTCHLFYPLAQAELYRDVTFIRHWQQRDDLRTLQFARTLEARPDLFSLVRSLSLRSALMRWDDYYHNLNYEGNLSIDTFILHPLLRQLTSFSHLRTLRLDRFNVDADCLTAIRTLCRLKRFEVYKCRIVLTLPHETPRNLVPELNINFGEHDTWGMLASSGTRSLAVEDPNWAGKAKSFISHGVHDALTKFVWRCDEYPVKNACITALCDFLEHCTQLQSLTITIGNVPRVPIKLSSEALPMLTEFEGPAEYAKEFIKDRPVCNVSLYFFPRTPTDVLGALQLSSVPVSSLVLRFGPSCFFGGWTDEVVELILKNLPSSLRRISLNQSFRESEMLLWLTALYKVPPLHTIEIIDHTFDIFHQEELVREFSMVCQSLRVIDFIGRDVEKWRWRDGCIWELYHSI